MSLLQPRVLRYLAAVAQTGSIQAAAREVSISASAIDRQLLQLEAELGVPLFEREPRGMRMTAAGEVVLALAQRWRLDINRTLSDLKQLQGVNQGQLRLAAMDSHANGLLPSFVSAVAAAHPGIVLEVELVTPDEAVRRLHEGDVDLAIAFNVKASRELHLVWTTELPLGCLVGAQHPLAARRSIALKDLSDWSLAVQSRALTIRRYLERKHAWLLAETRPPLVTNSLQMVKSLVLAGTHVALTSELDAAPELMAGTARFVPVSDLSAQPQTASVAISARRPLPRIARVVAELLASHTADYLQRARQAATPEQPKRRKAQPA